MNLTGIMNQLDKLAPNIGMSHSEKRKMVNPFLCLMNGKPVLDIVAFGDWMESKYPEYRDKSIEQFLLDKDPESIAEWKSLFDIA